MNNVVILRLVSLLMATALPASCATPDRTAKAPVQEMVPLETTKAPAQLRMFLNPGKNMSTLIFSTEDDEKKEDPGWEKSPRVPN